MGFLRKIRLHGQCTSEAVATPAQLTSPKPTPTSENGDRCSGWLATTPMTPRPTHLRRPWTGLKRPGFKVFYEIWALHAFGAVRPPTVFQRGPLRKAGIRAGPARCRIHRKGRNSETPANWALRQIPAQSRLLQASRADRQKSCWRGSASPAIRTFQFDHSPTKTTVKITDRRSSPSRANIINR